VVDSGSGSGSGLDQSDPEPWVTIRRHRPPQDATATIAIKQMMSTRWRAEAKGWIVDSILISILLQKLTTGPLISNLRHRFHHETQRPPLFQMRALPGGKRH